MSILFMALTPGLNACLKHDRFSIHFNEFQLLNKISELFGTDLLFSDEYRHGLQLNGHTSNYIHSPARFPIVKCVECAQHLTAPATDRKQMAFL